MNYTVTKICILLLFSEIMGDVIKATTEKNKTPGKLEWRVLIVDSQSMRMVSACTKMHELSAEGITSKLHTSKCIWQNSVLMQG